MTTQPINHRAEAGKWLAAANEAWHQGTDLTDASQLGILHALLGIHDLLAELRDEDGPEPRHRRELDEDDPDTLAEDDDTVEQPRFGLAHIDDVGGEYEPREEPADRVRLSGFAAIHRHDDFGPPWGAA